LRLWDTILNWLVEVVTPLDGHVIGLIKILLSILSYLTFIEVDVPMPTDSLGIRLRLTISPSTKLWDVETDTCACILWSLAVTWSKLDFKLYSKLLDPTLVSPTNDNPIELVKSERWVTIPI